MSLLVSQVSQHPPVVAFRRSPNHRDLLVTAKLPSNSANPQLPCGSFRCGKNCATCHYISHGLTTYTFFSTGETRPIKFNLSCETEAGLASRNIVRLQKILLRCVDFCFYFLHINGA